MSKASIPFLRLQDLARDYVRAGNAAMAGESHGQRSDGKRERWLMNDTAAAIVETMEKGV